MSLLHLFWSAEVVGCSVALLCAGRRRQFRVYPWFLAYLGMTVVRSLLRMNLQLSEAADARFWVYFQPMFIGLQIAMVWEIFHRTLPRYHLAGRIAERLAGGILLLAVMVGLVFSLTEVGSRPQFRLLVTTFDLSRAVTWACVVILLLLHFLVRLFPVWLTRAEYAHRWLVMTYIGVGPGIALLASRLGQHRQGIVFTVIQLLEAVCVFAWAWLVKPAAEPQNSLTPGRTTGEALLLLEEKRLQAIKRVDTALDRQTL